MTDLFCSSEIFAGSCIDLNLFAGFDEDGNLNNCACFNCSSLCNVCSCVALYAGFAVCYEQVYKVFGFYDERAALEGLNCNFVVFSDPLDSFFCILRRNS